MQWPFSISDIELTFNIDRGSPRLLLCSSHRQLTLMASPTEAVSTSDGSVATIRFVTCAQCAADTSLRSRLRRRPRTVIKGSTRMSAFNILGAFDELPLRQCSRMPVVGLIISRSCFFAYSFDTDFTRTSLLPPAALGTCERLSHRRSSATIYIPPISHHLSFVLPSSRLPPTTLSYYFPLSNPENALQVPNYETTQAGPEHTPKEASQDAASKP